MNLAYFSPLSPVRSGISRYSEDLLPHLSQLADIDLYVDGYLPTNPGLVSRFRVTDVQSANPLELPRHAIPFYHVGNSSYHEYIYRALQRFPGVTVLHDVVLHHLVYEMTVAKGRASDYIHEMLYCHGTEGAEAARMTVVERFPLPYDIYPLHRRVVDASLRVIVHSESARSTVASSTGSLDVDVVPLLALPTATEGRRGPARSALGLTDGEILFSSVGLVTRAKRMHLVLPAFKHVHQLMPRTRFVVVGDVAADVGLVDIISSLGLHDCVLVTGFVDRFQLDDYVAATDVGVCLRWPTMGESSASLLKFLGGAVPSIVSDVGSFAEVPGDCCVKIPIGADEEDRLFEEMIELARNVEKRRALGQRALEHVRTHHSPETVAAGYIASICRAFE